MNAATALEPVAANARISSVDTLRGFALLGILAMNIITFGLPSESYMDPMNPALAPYQGAFEGANRVSWWICHVFFDQKMMSTFSMLFGAGLVLMAGRARSGDDSQPPRFAAVYYRRIGWLLLIGLLHAYLIWYGDILTSYAICGLLLYPLRQARPAILIPLGFGVMCVTVLIMLGMGFGMSHVRDAAAEAQRTLAAGGDLNDEQRGAMEGYQAMTAGMNPTPEKIAATVAAMRGSLPDVLRENATQAIMLQTFIFAIWTVWRALGLMLVGMGMMKLGVFAAARSIRFYAIMAMVGLGVGLPMAAYGGSLLVQHRFDMIDAFGPAWHFNYFGSFFVALGYTGVVMLICKTGVLSAFRALLAAVGQMALTNYLMQSLLMTFIFYGWGLGYFGHFERSELFLFVAGTWAVQLIVSPIWLARYRFGPAEWVWRSLTYLRRQPMRRNT